MINNNEQSNPTLTFQQLQSLEEYKSRLTNIQGEILVGNKNLTAIKSDTARITKEKDYQTELLGKVNIQALEAKSKLDTLNKNIQLSTESLSALTQEIAKKTANISSKEMALKEKENVISIKEHNLVTRETSVGLREEDVKKSEEELSTKHAKIKFFAENLG